MSKEKTKKFSIKNILNYIGKLISTAALILLIIVGGFLVYYLVSVKMVAQNPMYEPKVNIYTIVSGSMEPTIKVYDVIIVYRVDNPNDIKVGDVITFKSTSSISKDLIVTHRVVEIKEVNGHKEFVTKGDFNATIDGSTAKFENIIGRVIFKIPQLGRAQLFIATKMGWFLVVLLPAAGVIIYDVVKLIRLISIRKRTNSIDDSDLNESKKEKIEDKLEQNEINRQLNESVNETLDKIKSEIDKNDLSRLKKELEDEQGL